jgi:hypothetical protein
VSTWNQQGILRPRRLKDHPQKSGVERRIDRNARSSKRVTRTFVRPGRERSQSTAPTTPPAWKSQKIAASLTPQPGSIGFVFANLPQRHARKLSKIAICVTPPHPQRTGNQETRPTCHPATRLNWLRFRNFAPTARTQVFKNRDLRHPATDPHPARLGSFRRIRLVLPLVPSPNR